MREHYHGTIEHILLYGVSALIFLNIWRLVAVQLGKQEGAIGTIGTSMGALTHFGN